jgi:hypothetical protein
MDGSWSQAGWETTEAGGLWESHLELRDFPLPCVISRGKSGLIINSRRTERFMKAIIYIKTVNKSGCSTAIMAKDQQQWQFGNKS